MACGATSCGLWGAIPASVPTTIGAPSSRTLAIDSNIVVNHAGMPPGGSWIGTSGHRPKVAESGICDAATRLSSSSPGGCVQSSLVKEQCSMVSTPASTESEMPCTPWQWAATGIPSRCASSTATLKSSAVNWDCHAGVVGVPCPPVAMIFTTSQPRSARSMIAARSSSRPSHSPFRYQQCPPGGVIGGPEHRIVGSASSLRRSSVTKLRSPRSRRVVTPPVRARWAFARARRRSSSSERFATCSSRVPLPSNTRC